MGYGQYSYNHIGRTNPLANEPREKRTKQVFDTSEIPHLWAHRTQHSARNKQGNLYFSGTTIFSYRSHFPIAAHVVNRKGERAVLFTTNSYGPTTGGHISAVRSAIPDSVRRFCVNLERYMLPDDNGKLAESEFARIIGAYQAKVKEFADCAIGARVGTTIQRWLDRAQEELAELNKFIAFFNLPGLSERARIPSRKLPFIPASVEAAKELGKAAKQAAALAAKKERERKLAAYKVKIAEWMAVHPDYAPKWDGTVENAEALYTEWRTAEENARKLSNLTDWMESHPDVAGMWDKTLEHGQQLKSAWQAEDAQRRNAKRIAAWRKGEGNAYGLPHEIPTMLRVSGDNVETSRGASFPIEHARRGLALVRAVMARGEEWHTNGHSCHLGHYRIERITPDGTVYAGCHEVTWTEIERIASELETTADNAQEGR